MKRAFRRLLLPVAMQTSARQLAFAMTFVLVLSGVFAPMMPVMNAAAEAAQSSDALQPLEPLNPEEPEEVPTEVPTDESEMPPTEETLPEGEEQLPEEEEQPDAELEQEPVSNIHINLFWCDETVSLPTATDGGPLKGLCTSSGPPPGTADPVVTVSLSSGSTGAWSPSSGSGATTFPASVQFDNLPGETWSLQFNVAVAGESALFCEGFTPYGNTKPYARYALVSGGTNLDTYTGEEAITCDWFGQMPASPEATGISLTIYKWECPAGTMYGQAEDYYSAECATEQAGVPFQITDDNGTQDTTSDTNGRQIDNLVGQITIQEMIPGGYSDPVVYCQLLNDPTPTLMTSTSGLVTLQATTADDYQCFWYNLPDDSGGAGDVLVYKWECADTPPQNSQYDWYLQNCTTAMNGVTFVLDRPDPEADIQTDTGDSISGAVMMGGVDVGNYPLTETVPANYTPAAVFCATVGQSETPTAGQYMPYPLTNTSITADVSANNTLYCQWFNVPTEHEGISLTIYKWECPEGTTYGQADSYYSAECATEQAGVPFQITDDNGTQDTTSDTNGRQIDNLVGEITIQEMIPGGYGDPVVYCQLLNDPAPTLMTSTNGLVTLQATTADDYQCFWYNIPAEGSTVTIYKWRCPDGMPSEQTQQWFETNCTTSQDGITFTLTDTVSSSDMVTTGGMVQWTDVAVGAIQITETVPPGYAPHPYVVCEITEPGASSPTSVTPATINGTWNSTITTPGTEILCDWYNWYLGPGEITVYKWTCPEGYDRTAWGADPMTDCTTATNGVTFKVDQPDPEVDLFSDTGDSVDGAVYFGGLQPGDYTLTEMIGAGEMQDVFVWQCYGLNTSSVQPTPLSVGQDLSFTIAGGDKIVCHWFNVPYPQHGWIDVTKFNCTTETYVKDVYCYTNQTGQEFNLQVWVNGTGWTTVQSGKTDVSGKVTFSDLEAGAYQLIEPNGKACLMKSSNITSGGFIGVEQGAGTTVYVYNCKTPPPPQKTPTKYPNTGVEPSAEHDVTRTPGIELAGLLSVIGLRLSRRRLMTSAALIATGTAVSTHLPASTQPLQPIETTPPAGTPDPSVFGCGGTPEAWVTSSPEAGTPQVDPCDRGAIPIHIRIPIIEIDAAIEYLEIIDGQMQPPTGATDVTWYKETNRLGEIGNGIYAGHLNYWGVPEGVFFRLESLKEGDVIEIDGDDLQTYLFEVQWMQNFPSDEEPPDDALGVTDIAAITLITCGGEWIADRAEYDHRTLVRAVLRE